MTDTPKDPELCARIADLKNEITALRAELAKAKGEVEEIRQQFKAANEYLGQLRLARFAPFKGEHWCQHCGHTLSGHTQEVPHYCIEQPASLRKRQEHP